MEWTEVERLAHEFRLDVAVLRQVALPAIAFTPAPTSGAPSPHGCYFGGLPLLPVGTAWPLWSPAHFCAAERQTARDYIVRHPSASPHWTKEIRDLDALEARGDLALQFLAQLDLAELAVLAPTHPLPSTGLLLVFAEFNVTGAAAKGRADPTPPWRVIWIRGDELRVLVTPPADREGVLHEPHAMLPRRVFTFPERVVIGEEVVYEQLGGGEYGEFLGALEARGVRGRNQVGGHVFRLQDGDAQERVAQRHHGFDIWAPPPRNMVERIEHDRHEWRALFQVAEDYGPPTSWSGVASFWGLEGPSSRGEFEAVEVHYEDT